MDKDKYLRPQTQNGSEPEKNLPTEANITQLKGGNLGDWLNTLPPGGKLSFHSPEIPEKYRQKKSKPQTPPVNVIRLEGGSLTELEKLCPNGFKIGKVYLPKKK